MNLSDDDFTLFGLPQRQALEPGVLDEARRALQALVHPDRFAVEGATAQRLATQWAVRVNQAHQRLRRPLSRAAYLCELRGVPVQAEQNTAMPPAFLMTQMQWRETLEEAGSAEEVQALALEVTSAQARGVARLQQLLDEANDVPGAARQVRELMFIERFADDVAARLDSFSIAP